MLSRARNYGVLACAFATALCISINTRTQAQGIQDSTGLNLPSSQTPTDTDHNTKLHIGVDRTDPHAFEPIYLVLTAERFLPDTTPQLMIAKGTGNYQAVTIPEKAWVKSEAPGAGETPLQRLGTVLQMKTPSDTTRDYLFSSPGEYKLLVKMGPDSTTLTLSVRPPEIGEQEAWDQLGSKINNILDNQLDDQPEQATVDLCGDIIRRYPRSVCAQYCRAYLNISRFKLAFNQSGKTGGVAAYGAITADLAKDNDTFAGTFFGEMTGFYTCYTVGLTHKFDQLLKIAEAVKTHFTPYSDALGGMHMEVLQHMTPIVIPVDPGASPGNATLRKTVIFYFPSTGTPGEGQGGGSRDRPDPSKGAFPHNNSCISQVLTMHERIVAVIGLDTYMEVPGVTVRTLVILAICCFTAHLARAEATPTNTAATHFFELHIRPLLIENCDKCHGSDPSKIKANLDLTTQAGFLRGGDDGFLVDPKNPADSLLLKMVSYSDDDHQMPPRKKLSADKIALLTQWIAQGAPWTADAKETSASIPQEDPGNYWAYAVPKRPAIPSIPNQTTSNPIDAFLQVQLHTNNLKPNPPADRITLIRRATYDLTGLPPTQLEITAFLTDESPSAWEKVIDRLLASPHYGEKWGRHWLDLVGFAETNGYERDADKPNAWRYRDYVIRSFNQNKPYDRFIKEQLAGDEISPRTSDCVIATGYYRLGIWDDEPADKDLARYDVLDGIVATTSQVMLGMSMNCARCHNHKRDPILQDDYYRLLAFFHHVTPMATNGAAIEMPVKYERSSEPALQTALCVTELPEHIDTYVLGRGNPQSKLKVVTPGFPKVLGFPDPVITPDKAAGTSGRRTALADWITSPANPLTARVMVNRIWQYHFGRGIVSTPNDFGKLGELPTNQPLLDYLACEFTTRHWDIKSMHKLMMMSQAYQMSSTDDSAALVKDPANNLFWRFNMRRLTAEEIRDSILFANDTLNFQMGGPSIFPEMPPAVLATSSRPTEVWGHSSPDQACRRSVYVKVKRSLLYPLLSVYDEADTDASTAVRFSTTVPTQALTMLNSVFMNQQADIFAHQLEKTDGSNTMRQINDALTAVTQRIPPTTDISRGQQFLQDMQQQEHMNPHDALKAFCLLSLNLNQFIYLD